MNILILHASPRKSSLTSQIIERFSQELPKEYFQEIVYLNDLNYQFCTACMQCRTEKKCIFAGDDLDILGQKIQDSDYLVIVSPVYWANMPAPLKAVFDRNVFRFMGENSKGIPTPLMKNKKAILFALCTTPAFFDTISGQSKGLFRAFNEIFKTAGIKLISKKTLAGTKKHFQLPDSFIKTIQTSTKKII